MTRRTVVVLGKGDLAIRVADWFDRAGDWELTRVIPVVPEPVWTGSLTEWAARRGTPVVDGGDWRGVPGDGRAADLAFSVFYDRIVGPAFLARFGRVLNLHNGPLPRYRGVAPINWALKNGETQHGVTIHEVTPGIDDGAVVGQVTYSIYPEIDEVADVYRRALGYGWTLFEQTLPLLDRIEPRPQDERLATYYTAGDRARLGERSGFTRAVSEAR